MDTKWIVELCIRIPWVICTSVIVLIRRFSSMVSITRKNCPFMICGKQRPRSFMIIACHYIIMISLPDHKFMVHLLTKDPYLDISWLIIGLFLHFIHSKTSITITIDEVSDADYSSLKYFRFSVCISYFPPHLGLIFFCNKCILKNHHQTAAVKDNFTKIESS